MIKHMLKDLNDLMVKLSAAMRNKYLAKEAMTEDQINALASFHEFYAGATEKLRHDLSYLSGEIKTVEPTAGDIDNIDFDQLHGCILNISRRQNDAVVNISGIISAARDTLQFIA